MGKRIFYAVKAAGVAALGTATFTEIHGLQSVGMTTRFNLEPVFELGQISIYENIENIPEVEITTEKVLDGYPLVYHLCTQGATSPTLAGRSNIKTIFSVAFWDDAQDSASGDPVAQCIASGVFVSSVGINITTDGPAAESVTVVGNNKAWKTSSFTFSDAFDNTDSPLALTGSGGVNRREDLLMGECIFPADIPGISASGTNNKTADEYAVHMSAIRISTNLGRDELLELGRRGPYHRFVQFPTEVTCEIEVITLQGDRVSAAEESEANLTERQIYIQMREGTRIDLGTKNKLSQVTSSGANAGTGGGNETVTYSYSNFNDLTIQHPKDPTAALRP